MSAAAQQPIEPIETLLASEQRYNDTFNARALIDQHGDTIRYVKGWGWLAWDGQRWERDAEHLVIEKAKDTLEKLGVQALQMPARRERDALLGHVSRSLDFNKLKNMVAAAESDKRIRHEPADFDRDPLMLNVQNGTIDLRTGKLRDADPADMITQVAACEYDSTAHADLWEDFVLWVANDRTDLRDYLQAALGYSLTGLTSEKCLFFAYGPSGDNGKSTLLEAVLHVLGDYGASTRIETVLSRGGSGGAIPNDLAALVGKRFVITSEAEIGQQFRTAQMKRLTGSDTIQARFMHQEWFNFRPVLKLWLAANNKPDVPESGRAVWGRVKLLPFENAMPKEKQDKQLGEKLQEAAPAILAWMVKGCLRYQAEKGLHEPECMLEAQADYQSEQDLFQAFIEERCELVPDAWTKTSGELLLAYMDWYRDTYARSLDISPTAFHTLAEQHGLKKKRRNGGWGIVGLRLRATGSAGTPQPAGQSATGDDDYNF